MSTQPSPSRRPVEVPADPATRLLAAADALAATVELEPGPPRLVGLVDAGPDGSGRGPGTRPDALTLTSLSGPDPVAALLGLTALPAWWAVGLAAGGTAHPLDDESVRWPTAFVHLVARDGTAVTVSDDGIGGRVVEGPDTDPQLGRVPDLCRRVLGLPTAPPPCGLAPHLVDLWLGSLVHEALDRPGLSWAEAAALHPAIDHESVPSPTPAPSPATLVRATEEFDDPEHWRTYLAACVAQGRSPGEALGATALGWLDAGSFARWMLGEAAPYPVVLEHLDAMLPATTADLVFATVQLSPASPWPPCRDGR